MSYKEIQDLQTEKTTALGGTNRKTGKPNPKQVEGYFMGSRTVESNKSKDGVCKLHIFQTATGNLGVWGKTDLDRKLANAQVGAMVRATCTGTQPIPGKNDMYKYKVEVDTDNTIEVASNLDSDAQEDSNSGGYNAEESLDEETGLDDEETPVDEIQVSRPKAPARPAATSNGAAKRVQDLLNARKNAS